MKDLAENKKTNIIKSLKNQAGKKLDMRLSN